MLEILYTANPSGGYFNKKYNYGEDYLLISLLGDSLHYNFTV